MMYTYLNMMKYAMCPSKMKEMYLLPAGCSRAVTGSTCVAASAQQSYTEHLLMYGKEG